MPAPGNEDYRLNEIERRLRTLEQEGSPAAQRLRDRLDYEREVRQTLAQELRGDVATTKTALDKRIDAIENTLTWGIRLFIGSVLLVVVGILIALATNQPG